MDETFRLKRSIRNLALALLPFLLAVDAAALYTVRTIDSPHPVAMACLFLGVPSMMAGLAALMLLGYWRARLTIRGESLTDRGVVREKSIDLQDVTEARWRIGPEGGSVLLRTGSERLAIGFSIYEAEERERIIRHLRSALPLEVQVDWNLYAYKVEPFEPRTLPAKPGPDEILVSRNDWDRYLWPSLAVTGLAGVVAWWFTGELRPLTFPLWALGLWVNLRFMTPAEGMVARKLSASSIRISPEKAHFCWFCLFWLAVAMAGLAVNEHYRPRMDHLDAILIVGMFAWFGILIYEAYLLDRRMARRDREAADLAAKARGESPTDAWPAD